MQDKLWITTQEIMQITNVLSRFPQNFHRGLHSTTVVDKLSFEISLLFAI